MLEGVTLRGKCESQKHSNLGDEADEEFEKEGVGWQQLEKRITEENLRSLASLMPRKRPHNSAICIINSSRE